MSNTLDVAFPDTPTDGNNIVLYVFIAIIVCTIGVLVFNKINKKKGR